MRVEVDQSGKVESTRTATVLAFSNKICSSILIPTSVKKRCHKYLKDKNCLPKTRHLRLFAASFVLLFQDHSTHVDQIVIDTEYKGSEAELKLAIKNAFKKAKIGFNLEKITFTQIGKRSKAHVLAAEILRKRKDPNRKIAFGEIKKLL